MDPERRERIIALSLLLGIFFGGLVLTFLINRSAPRGEWYLESNNTSPSPQKFLASPSPNLIFVEISGEVKKPGVYQFVPGTRVFHLLDKAGGLTEKADLDWVAEYINLAAKLKDSDKFFIPSISENALASSQNRLQKPQINSSPKQKRGKISLNNASLEELISLPGIGPVFARRIIENRPFSSVDELVRVKGIGPKTLAKIKPYLKVP